MQKVHNVNSKTGIIADPGTSKVSVKFGFSAQAGTNIIVKNGTSSPIFVRADVDDNQSLSFPTTDGAAASLAQGTHILAGSAETYECEIDATQISIVSNEASSGLVSVKIGEGY